MKRFDPIESLANARHEFGEHGGVNMSIEASTTFTFLDAEVMPEVFKGHYGGPEGGCYLYGRHYNPTVSVLGRQIAALEGAEAGYCTASGMSAIAGAILQCCSSGDHVVASRAIYGGSFALLQDYLPLKCGIGTTFVEATDLGEVQAAIRPRTKVLYVETLSNPTLRVVDIEGLSRLAKANNLTLIVDNTFSPLVLSPIQLGADVVVHSMTKYLGGASDVIAGAVCGRSEFVASLMDLHTGSLMLLGPTMDPRAAHSISLRLPHLGIRMKEHGRRAQFFAERLQTLGLPVIYPGLSDHPDHELLERTGNLEYGAGAVFCVDLGTRERADDLMEHLQNDSRFGWMAVSLGYFDTLMSCPSASTSSEMPEEEQVRAGIRPGLVRFSIGYTGSLDQRWQQMEAALREVGALVEQS